MFKKITVLMLAVLMIFSSVPFGGISAFAASENTESYVLTLEADTSEALSAENSSLRGISFFSRVVFDGCYANQLEGVAREIYDSFERNYAVLKKSGSYEYFFESPFTFNAEVKDGRIVTNDELKEIESIISMSLQVAMDAFLYDHPEVFWLKSIKISYGVSASGNEIKGYIGKIEKITIKPNEVYFGAAGDISDFDSAVEAVVGKIDTQEKSRYDILKSIHDYICNTAWYNLIQESVVHTAAPVFIGDGGVVCEGYAKSFKILCDEFDIPCVLVSGDAGGAHMWNYVQLDDGKWYLVDATWDDQDSKIYDTYFLANANTVGFNGVKISNERTEKTDFSSSGYKNFVYPVLSVTAHTAHTHIWDNEYTVDVEPTCTQSGSKSRHCTVIGCSEKKNVTPVSPTDHINRTEHAKQDETCVKPGYTAGVYCPDCKIWLSGHEVIPASGHLFENYISDNNATCTVNGTKTSKCERCDATDTIVIPDSKLDHTWGEWKVLLSPSCTVVGYEKRYCKNCTASEGRSVETTNHANAYTVDAVSATCSAVGYTSGLYCSECDFWVSGHEEIPALGHVFENYEYDNNATCAADGTKTAKCERCDATDTVSVEGTKLPHSWGEWVNIVSPSCTSGGLEGRSCKNCTASETRSVGVTNHANAYITNDVGSTCTEMGYTAGLYCPDCKIWLSGHEEIPSLGHNFKNYISDNNATCTADGTKTAKCERCDATDTVTDEGSKVAHSWNEWVSIVSPSCTVGGLEGRSCKNCNASENRSVESTNHAKAYITYAVISTCTEVGYTGGLYCPDCNIWISGHEEVPSLGHDFKNYISDNNASCTADGTKTAKCERCDETDTVTDEGTKGSHDWNEWAIISLPTCTVGGLEGRSCKNCAASENRSVAATNHANAYFSDAVSGSCTEIGYTFGLYCPDCDFWIYGHEVVPAPGHSFKNYISDNNATCTSDGTKTAECERCDKTDTVADNGSKLSHNWSEWEVENYPTCTVEGVKVRNCILCAESETQQIEPTNHPDAYYVEGEAATCTTNGYTGGMYCYVCETWVSGHAVTEKLPHKFTKEVVDEAHLVSAATVIDFAVYGYECEDCGEISDTVTFTHGERLPLGKTSKITAIQDASTIKLTWTAVEYAVGYKVYQKVGNSWKALGNVTSATARIRNLSAGTKYSFAVKAATRIDGNVVWSKDYTTISTATQVALPTTVKTKQTASAIQLIWNSCSGATGYRIYAVEGTEMTYLGQVKGTSATLRNLKAGTKYTYAIRPYLTLDDGSVVWSAYKTYTAATTPANPATTVTSASKGKITVKWKAVSGAEAYQLYYKTGNGSYKLYKNYTGANTVNFSNLKSGTAYTFAVRAAIKTSGGWIYGSYTPVNVTVK